jgi:hypothetical protein
VILNNPTRVTERQRRFIEYVGDRYQPVLPNRKIGIVVLRDSRPEEPETFFEK